MHIRRHPRWIFKHLKPGWLVITDGFAVGLFCLGFVMGCAYWWIFGH